MKTAFKKITIFFIIFLLLLPQIPLNEKERISAQTEEFKISCETEVPVGEALSHTKDLTKTLSEDLDFMVTAFLNQEHAVKRIYRLSDGAELMISWGLLMQLLPPSLVKILNYIQDAWAILALKDLIDISTEISQAIDKITDGVEGIASTTDAYKKIREDIQGFNGFDGIFINLTQGVTNIKDGITQAVEAGKIIIENIDGPGEVTGGLRDLNNADNAFAIIGALSRIFTGIGQINKIINAINTIDESLDLMGGAAQKVLIEGTDGRVNIREWQCLDSGCEKGSWTCYGGTDSYQTLKDCAKVCSGLNQKCSCLKGQEKGQTGLCLIENCYKDITDILDDLKDLVRSLEKVRDGIKGIGELKEGLEELDELWEGTDVKPGISGMLGDIPADIRSAIESGMKGKEVVYPLLDKANEALEKIGGGLEKLLEMLDGAINLLRTVEKPTYQQDEENPGATEVRGTTFDRVTDAIGAVINNSHNIIETIRDVLPDDIPGVGTFFVGILKGIGNKIKGYLSDDDPEVKKEAENLDEQINWIREDFLKRKLAEDAEASTDLDNDLTTLDTDMNAENTANTTESEEESALLHENALEGTFSLLNTDNMDELMDELTFQFETISIQSIFNLETLLDIVGLNRCNCKKCIWCSPSFNFLGVGIPPICWGSACPIGQIKTYVNLLGALWNGDWGFLKFTENIFYLLTGKKEGRIQGVKQAMEEVDALIYTRENRIWREGEPEELSLGNLTKAEFYLIIKELAGKELEDCFVTTKMFEKGESLKYLFSCENALKENLIPQSEYEPGTEGWKQTIEGRCYLYPNNFVCCQ